MQLYEYLKSKKIIESDFKIEKLKFFNKSGLVDLYFKIDQALNYEQYMSLTKELDSFLKEHKFNFRRLVINYGEQNSDKQIYLSYLQPILNKLSANNPRFNALDCNTVIITKNHIEFVVAHDASGLDELLQPIAVAYEEYGLEVVVSLKKDETKSISEAIMNSKKQIEADINLEKSSVLQERQLIDESKKIAKNRPTYRPVELEIKDLPATQNELMQFYSKYGNNQLVTISAHIFDVDIRSFNKSKVTNLATLKVTDDTDSIVVKRWIREEQEIDFAKKTFIKNACFKITGKLVYDLQFSRGIYLEASRALEFTGMYKPLEVKDLALTKRVELHCHTKMSNLDGLSEPKDYLDLAVKWGWKAMAFTDHNGVYSIPDIAHALEKNPDFKPIYGVELNYVADDAYFITFDERDISLKDAGYVVFDIETTGLSQSYDEIIEIAACKVYQGGIIDTFEAFVNPKMPIPAKIAELTTITDEMVKDALPIEEVLPRFMDFCKDSILVAHNAKFDVGMIYRDIKRYNLGVSQMPVIDTLNLFRAGYYSDNKSFNLKAMAKYFKIKQEQHHRAIDDTRVTANCFIKMLADLNKKEIYNYNQINNLIDKDVFWRYVIPAHLTVLATNPVGYKNMYKIISDSLTDHFYNGPRALKSVIEKYREGILVGSSCVNGNVFELALNRSVEELQEEIKYYDYIEVQPPRAYAQLFDDMPNGQDHVKEVIAKIITNAQKLGKIVVATSDCHYTRPELKKYRDIMIASPQIGGGTHPLERYSQSPDMHLRTTEEMLEEFAFVGSDLAYEIVVKNTNLIADKIEKISAFKKEMFAPKDDEFKDSFIKIPSITAEVRRIVDENKVRLYGQTSHQIVEKRIKRELDSIISNGYASVYYMSHLLVVKSLSDGYLVGSRGSVGSSLVATMMNITEINPLPPHYRCCNCHFHTFKMNDEELNTYGLTEIEAPFQAQLRSVDSGYDLPDALCPVCNAPLAKDGHDIPFETFLGFNGDKVPDIDLNFSGEYQAIAHEYVRTLMGPENAFRSGTVGTIAERNAYGYVQGYCEKKNIDIRDCEKDRLASYLVGIKRSTGQHPGGIIVVPHYVDIYDVTPIQYPADNTENNWRTTHYDYHSFENNLLKLDILGHDDPTLIKYFMDYVHEHQEDFPFSSPQDIPIDDKNVYRLFSETEIIGVKKEDIDSAVSSFAVPEFGTNFVRQMLVETLPKTFAQLVKISGLSHGTDVWNTNAQDLVAGKTEFGKIPFKDIIGCRDDIMVDLIRMGLDSSTAFNIMEFVRKGKAAKDKEGWKKYKDVMLAGNVPEWYIWSCERIQYMFPKAHATAYVLMALRIAWFKVNSPALFYSAWFSKRAKNHSLKAYLGGKLAIKSQMLEIYNNKKRTATDDDKYTALQVALEMVCRGIKFLPVDINKSAATIFEIEDGNLRLPFNAVDSLGESIALDIVAKREERPFTSKKDVRNRTRLSQSLFDEFEIMRAFGNLPDEDIEEAQGLFAFSNI